MRFISTANRTLSPGHLVASNNKKRPFGDILGVISNTAEALGHVRGGSGRRGLRWMLRHERDRISECLLIEAINHTVGPTDLFGGRRISLDKGGYGGGEHTFGSLCHLAQTRQDGFGVARCGRRASGDSRRLRSPILSRSVTSLNRAVTVRRSDATGCRSAETLSKDASINFSSSSTTLSDASTSALFSLEPVQNASSAV